MIASSRRSSKAFDRQVARSALRSSSVRIGDRLLGDEGDLHLGHGVGVQMLIVDQPPEELLERPEAHRRRGSRAALRGCAP